jgi:hypothetical protein
VPITAGKLDFGPMQREFYGGMGRADVDRSGWYIKVLRRGWL